MRGWGVPVSHSVKSLGGAIFQFLVDLFFNSVPHTVKLLGERGCFSVFSVFIYFNTVSPTQTNCQGRGAIFRETMVCDNLNAEGVGSRSVCASFLFSRSALFLFFQALLLVGFTIGLSFFFPPQKPSPPCIYMYMHTPRLSLGPCAACARNLCGVCSRAIYFLFIFYGVSSRAITHTQT